MFWAGPRGLQLSALPCSSHTLQFASNIDGDLRCVIFYFPRYFSCLRFALNSRKTMTPSRLEASRFFYFLGSILPPSSKLCAAALLSLEFTTSLNATAQGRYTWTRHEEIWDTNHEGRIWIASSSTAGRNHANRTTSNFA